MYGKGSRELSTWDIWVLTFYHAFVYDVIIGALYRHWPNGVIHSFEAASLIYPYRSFHEVWLRIHRNTGIWRLVNNEDPIIQRRQQKHIAWHIVPQSSPSIFIWREQNQNRVQRYICTLLRAQVYTNFHLTDHLTCFSKQLVSFPDIYIHMSSLLTKEK